VTRPGALPARAASAPRRRSAPSVPGAERLAHGGCAVREGCRDCVGIDLVLTTAGSRARSQARRAARSWSERSTVYPLAPIAREAGVRSFGRFERASSPPLAVAWPISTGSTAPCPARSGWCVHGYDERCRMRPRARVTVPAPGAQRGHVDARREVLMSAFCKLSAGVVDGQSPRARCRRLSPRRRSSSSGSTSTRGNSTAGSNPALSAD